MTKRRKGLPNYPGSQQLYLTLGILTMIEAACIIMQAVFLSKTIVIFFEKQPLNNSYLSLTLFLVGFVGRHIFQQIGLYLTERFSMRTEQELRRRLIHAYLNLGPHFTVTEGTGKLVTLAIEGLTKVKAYFELSIPKMIRSMIVPTAVILTMAYYNLFSAIIAVIMIPIIVLFMILLGLTAQALADKQYDTYRQLSNHFVDTLKGLETLKFLGRSKNYDEEIAQTSESYRKATVKTLSMAFTSSFALDFFTTIAIAFVALNLGVKLIDGDIHLYPALTILIMIPEFFLPIKQAGADYHATLDGQVALNEVEQIIHQLDDLPHLEQHQQLQQIEQIKLNQIDYCIDDAQLLTNIDLTIKAGEHLALVGASGAGKSTLIQLIAGYTVPTSGNFEVNDQMMLHLLRSDWLQHVAYIPQQPYIFPLSLKDNILFYQPDASIEQVTQVIEQVGLSALVAKLPQGMETLIGDGGQHLSGGQEQRIAIARAMLSPKSIIILDEPTAHLDIETEFEIKQNLLTLFKNRTVILATHRLHWLKDMSRVVILEQGKIITDDSYNNLKGAGILDELNKKVGGHTDAR